MNHPVKKILAPTANTWLAIGSGLLLFLASPGAVGWWPLIFLALAPLILAVVDLPPAKALRLGLLAGFIHYTTLLYWIVIVLGVYGYLSWWVSVPALLLLALYMSLYPAAFAAAVSLVARRGMGPLLWVAPAIWVALDFIRGRLFTGFPWQDLAYSLYQAPLCMQAADLAGHHGITFLIVLINCLLVVGWTAAARPAAGLSHPTRQRLLYTILPALVLVMAATLYSLLRYRQVLTAIKASPSLAIAVVQGNISQDEKWTPQMRDTTLAIYSRLSSQVLAQDAAAAPPLLIWPETALPIYLKDDQPLPAPVEDLVREKQIWLLTGVPYIEAQDSRAAEAGPRYYNSAILVGPDGTVRGRYNKNHLVPFGEYIPFRGILPMLAPIVENMGDFSSGEIAVPLVCPPARIGALICYESIFPELARQWVDCGANLLVNMTNDAWFGRSSAPWQHLSMAVLRAVETRRSLARAANTGVSGFIDPLGRLPAASALFVPAHLTARLPLLETRTIYVRFGHYFPLSCVAASLLSLLWCRAGSRHP